MFDEQAGESTTLPLRSLPPPAVNNDTEVIVEQIKTNARRRLPVLEPRPVKDKPLLVVGGGPSLTDTIEVIRAMRPHCGVLAVNGAYNFLLRHGIVADYFLLIDSRACNSVHVESMQRETEAILSSQVHPSVFDLLDDRATIYHTAVKSAKRALSELGMDDVPAIPAMFGAAGIHALYIALVLGYRKLTLFGYDFSYRGVEHHAFEQKMNDGEPLVNVVLGGTIYPTSRVMAYAAYEFPRIAADLTRYHGAQIDVMGDGLLPAYLQLSNLEGDLPLEQRERDKYQRIWAHEQYSEHSPALQHVRRAVKALDMMRHETLLDFGCGTGRATAEFRSLGINATGIDIARNALATDVPFIEACLWSLPDLHADYGFCVDVMEHIPTEKVVEVLEGIHSRTRACYFNISTVDDVYGTLIDRRLHMTVMMPESWRSVLTKIWPAVEMTSAENEVVFVCRK